MNDSPPGVLSAAKLTLAIRRSREETPDSPMLATEPIAIIGIGCRFPGAMITPEDCWRVFTYGIDVITEVPAERWSLSDYYDPDYMASGKTNGRWGGFIADPYLFDPTLFGISPREAATIDPQQRILLEVAWEAIQDSGQAPGSLAGSRVGVFVGAGLSEYERQVFKDEFTINSNSCTGTCGVWLCRTSSLLRPAWSERFRRHGLLVITLGGSRGLPEPQFGGERPGARGRCQPASAA